MYINCYFKIRTRNLQILGVNDFPMSMMSSMLFNHTEYTKYFMRRCGSALDTAVVYADWALSLSRKKVGIIFLISPMKKQVHFFFILRIYVFLKSDTTYTIHVMLPCNCNYMHCTNLSLNKIRNAFNYCFMCVI